MKSNNPITKFPGFPPKPETNYWRYPRIMNGWWHILTGSEQKALDYLLRHTWGYNKTTDFISYKQFINGIKTKNGKWVDRGCGIKSSKTLAKALKGLIAKGFIEAVKFSGKTNLYRLKLINNEVENKEPLYKVKSPSLESKELGSLQSKETIKDITIKDTQQDEWIKKYGKEILYLIRDYPENIKDAIRITESKIRRGEKFEKPHIAYITTLCKRGAKWGDGEEAQAERYLKYLEENTKRINEEVKKYGK